MSPEVLGLVLPSRVAWLEVAQSFTEDLAAAMGFDEDGQFAVGMALREGLNNAILHGNRRDDSKVVEVSYLCHADRLEIRIKDEGPGFDVSGLPDPLAEQNLLKPSGRGVFLMRSFMDEVDLERAGRRGGEVRMIKRLPRAAEGQGSGQEEVAGESPASGET